MSDEQQRGGMGWGGGEGDVEQELVLDNQTAIPKWYTYTLDPLAHITWSTLYTSRLVLSVRILAKMFVASSTGQS